MRKDKFKDFETVPKDLDLVEEEDQFTHLVTLDDATEGQDILSKLSNLDGATYVLVPIAG